MRRRAKHLQNAPKHCVTVRDASSVENAQHVCRMLGSKRRDRSETSHLALALAAQLKPPTSLISSTVRPGAARGPATSRCRRPFRRSDSAIRSAVANIPYNAPVQQSVWRKLALGVGSRRPMAGAGRRDLRRLVLQLPPATVETGAQACRRSR